MSARFRAPGGDAALGDVVRQQQARRVGRRVALRTAGGAAALVGATAARLGSGTAYAQSCDALVGVWLVAFRPGTAPPGAPPVNPTPLLFTPDGALVVGFRPSAPSPQGRTYFGSALGLWTRTGERQVRWAYTLGSWDEQGVFQGRGQIRATVELSEAGDTFTGSFIGEVFDAAGTATASPAPGTLEGRRLLAAP
jgi:hypothetical protein